MTTNIIKLLLKLNLQVFIKYLFTYISTCACVLIFVV